MPFHRTLGALPRKHDLRFPRDPAASYQGEGPHSGTTLRRFEHTRTEEPAVMFDTALPLELTEQALAMDDPGYPLSWLA